ncbi:hypothetical protein BGX31_006337 [Mortierella sp. GBA43]|nr:hypothetical protein BGX31_006337 [Mortierella sp. GBA43]
MDFSKKHVVIIGAGISGLAAAHELSKHPSTIQVTILEARNRIGGRIDTRRNLFSGELGELGELGDIPIDLGASWIHGVDPSNPIVSLAEEAQVRLVATNDDVIYPRPGQDALDQEESNHYWAVLLDIYAKAQEYARVNRKRISATTSFRDWLDHFLATRQSRDPHLPNYMTRKELQFVPRLAQFWADENAIALDKVSLKYMDAEFMFPGDHCMVTTGYDKVLDILCKDMKGVDIRLEHVVERIEISTSKGLFTADVALVTLPLGVLKSNSVIFSPPLPKRKQLAIKRLGFGTMVKVVLRFPTCFWPKDMHFINFLSIRPSIPNTKLCRNLNGRQLKALATYMNDLANYTSLMPIHGVPILIGYMANESAEAFGKLNEQEAKQVLVCQLSHYFDVLSKDPSTYGPTHVYMTQWNADPYARGSYTSIPIGAHQSDLAEFEIPVGARSIVISTGSEHEESCETRSCVDNEAIMMDQQTSVAQIIQPRLNRKQRQQGVYQINPTTIPHYLDQFGSQALIHGMGDSSNGQNIGHGGSKKMRRTCSLIKSIFGLGSQSRMNCVDVEKHVDWEGAVARDQTMSTRQDTDVVHVHSIRQPIGNSETELFLGLQEHGGDTMKEVEKVRGLQCHRFVQLSQQLPAPLSETKSPATSINCAYIAGHEQGPDPSEKKREITFTKTIAVDDEARGRIHFAGEHTTPTSFASVHGALMTGQREAAKIVTQLIQL